MTRLASKQIGATTRARPPHETFANRDDEHLRQVLRDIVIHYFKQNIEVLLT